MGAFLSCVLGAVQHDLRRVSIISALGGAENRAYGRGHESAFFWRAQSPVKGDGWRKRHMGKVHE
jgi:hypothetical protein